MPINEKISMDRMDRIENKIDKLSEAVVAIARSEEKIHTLTSFSKQQSEHLSVLVSRIDQIERIVLENSTTITIINKIFWVIIVAAITAITGVYITN